MLNVTDLKKSIKAVDLALSAARKRQSPRTGFVHYFPNDESVSDTIPLFENFCFIMALFRQKTAESVLEAKGLLERLLSFQSIEGNFPVYLHDYPRTRSSLMPLKIAPVLIQILRHFSPVLNSEIKEKMELSLSRCFDFMKKQSLAPLWRHRYNCLLNQSSFFNPTTPEEYFETLISDQLVSSFPLKTEIPFSPDLQCFMGEHQIQEKGEPLPLAIEWLCAENQGYQKRLVQDHPHQMYAALLFPIEQTFQKTPPFIFTPQSQGGSRLLWGGNKLHSLVVPNGEVLSEGKKIIFHLDEEPRLERNDLFEAFIFCDLSSETEILIQGKTGTVFYFGEVVQIKTPLLEIEAVFTLLEGEGDFCGQISKANRPSQIACQRELLHEVFDWQIGLRTLRRSKFCKIQLTLSLVS